jgi:hypothetical protein
VSGSSGEARPWHATPVKSRQESLAFQAVMVNSTTETILCMVAASASVKTCDAVAILPRSLPRYSYVNTIARQTC